MRIFLDTRDLIGITERNRPAPIDEIRRSLLAGNHQLVYSFSNIREIAAPLAEGADFLRIRESLQRLESLPHVYMREVQIVELEIRAAVDAYTSGGEFTKPEIITDRWDRTLSPLPAGLISKVEMLINTRLDELVYMAYRVGPELFSAPKQHLPALLRIVAADRKLIKSGQLPAEMHFKTAIRNHSRTHKITLPAGHEDAFVDWVYANPARCPGVRLNHEVFRSLLANTNDVPETADFTDLAHVYALPYLEATTLDNRIRHYCRVASDTLFAQMGFRYSDRVHRNLIAILPDLG